jgi:hypothetical protein
VKPIFSLHALRVLRGEISLLPQRHRGAERILKGTRKEEITITIKRGREKNGRFHHGVTEKYGHGEVA